MAEPIKLPFAKQICVGPKNNALHKDLDPARETALSGRHVPVEQYSRRLGGA